MGAGASGGLAALHFADRMFALPAAAERNRARERWADAFDQMADGLSTMIPAERIPALRAVAVESVVFPQRLPVVSQVLPGPDGTVRD